MRYILNERAGERITVETIVLASRVCFANDKWNRELWFVEEKKKLINEIACMIRHHYF